jgi:predicted NBD/HSP70 family sugar kinase
MKRITADVKAVRGINRAAVLDYIREHAPAARNQVARHLHISPSTVHRVVEDLLREDLVFINGDKQQLVGRPSDLLEFNGDRYSVIGIDLGFPNMLGLLASFSGQIKDRENYPIVRGQGEENFTNLCNMIQALLESSIRQGMPVKGVGLGIPGIVSPEEGIVQRSPDLGWENFPLVSRLNQRFGMQIYIDRDINLLALGEFAFGAARGCKDIVCITLGTKIQAGIIINSELYTGHYFQAGQLGFSLPGIEYLSRNYSNQTSGALDEVASGMTVLKRGREILAKQLDQASVEQLNTRAVYDAARDGQDWAKAIINDVIPYLTQFVANLTVLLDPEIIVISGKISESAQFIVEPILAGLKNCIPRNPRLEVSSLGTRATVMGAIMMIYQGVIRADIR